MLRKKNFLVVTILILLVFLVTGCSGFLPKPTKGVISGRVLIPPTAKQLSKDISGWVGAAGAEVTIVDANGVKHTVITDENGYYNFENIAVKANTVVTATVKVDGKTMVLKTVIDKAVGKEQKYDSGAMTPESTALAIVVEHIQDVGGIVNLDEIKETDSYLDLLGKVTEVLEAQGNVEDDAGVQDLADEAVDEILYPDDGTPTPPTGDGGGTPTPKVIKGLAVEARTVDQLDLGIPVKDNNNYTLTPTVLVHIDTYKNSIGEDGKWVGLQLKPEGVTDITKLEYKTAKSSGFQPLTAADAQEAGKAGEIVWWVDAGIATDQWIELKYADEDDRTAIKLTVNFEAYVMGLRVEARTGSANGENITVGSVTGADGEYSVEVSWEKLDFVEGSTNTPHPGYWFGLQLLPEDVDDIKVLQYKTSIHTTGWHDFTDADVTEAVKHGQIVWWIDGSDDEEQSIWLKYKGDEDDRTAIKLTVNFEAYVEKPSITLDELPETSTVGKTDEFTMKANEGTYGDAQVIGKIEVTSGSTDGFDLEFWLCENYNNWWKIEFDDNVYWFGPKESDGTLIGDKFKNVADTRFKVTWNKADKYEFEVSIIAQTEGGLFDEVLSTDIFGVTVGSD